jgi:maltose/moltooligosaccharide transporter
VDCCSVRRQRADRFCVPLSLARTLFGNTESSTAGFSQAVLINGQIGGFYNFVAFLSAFAMIPLARRVGPQKLHAACLTLGGIGLLALPMIHRPMLLFVPMIGLGLSWASMMGNPYAMLAGSIPPERSGVYMGIFNMFIVAPMLLQIITIPMVYHHVLGDNPQNVIRVAGFGLMIGAALSLRIACPQPSDYRID